MMMNERIRKIAEEAGFIFWGDESWKPEGAVIDWASDYDQEFAKFAELIVRECAEFVKDASVTEDGHQWRAANYAMLDHFGVE